MQIKMKSRVKEIERGPEQTNIMLEFDGKVEDSKFQAKEAYMPATLRIRTIIADQLKVGSVFTIILSDEDQNEGTI